MTPEASPTNSPGLTPSLGCHTIMTTPEELPSNKSRIVWCFGFFTTVPTGDTVVIGRQPFQGWCCLIDLFPG